MRKAAAARAALAWAMLSLIPAPQAEAGFLLTLAGSPGQEAARLLVDRQALRLEDGGEILIYRRDKNLLWSLNSPERSYAEFTPEGAARLGEALEAAMKELQEQLKELPPEERGRMEGMLGRPPGAEITPPAAAYRKTAPGQRVGRWTCDRYELRVNGKKEGEACFARAATLGLGPEEARTLEAFFAFLGQLAEGMGAPVMGGRFKASAAEPPGVPVESVFLPSGTRPGGRTALTGVEPRAFPPALFEIPAGFRKEEIGR